MCATPVKRKLAAILATDAVGYSKLMSANEEGTLKVLAAHRAVIDGIIEFHEGRIINTAGDSVLAEFGSPVEAVRCAVEIQDALKTRNDSLPESQRMQFRIGVNLGDVMEKGEDLLGDGVNVAARLESIAEPGGICVSSSVYDQIAGKLDLGFVNIGTQSLKNIQRPIQVYRVERGGLRSALAAAAPGAAVPKPAASRAPVAWAVGGALASLAVLAALGWYSGLLPGTRSPDHAKAEAELARTRAEAEEERRRAKATAAAEEERRQQAEATAAAAEARRAQEEKRAAEARARTEAELARTRAEAEAARRKAAAEQAAAAEARRAAEASARASAAAAARRPPPADIARAESPAPAAASPRLAARAARPPSDYSGQWAAAISCKAFRGRPAFSSNLPVSVTNNTFNVKHGEPGQPGSFTLTGTPQPDGQLNLAGDGLAAGAGRRTPAQPFKAEFDGKFEGERFEGAGQLGAQDCTLAIARP